MSIIYIIYKHIMEKKPLREIINTGNKAETTLEEYKQIAEENMVNIFNLITEEKKIPVKDFLENNDHWAIHTYNVFKKALEIANEIEKETGIKTDKTLLYIMSWMHDSGRFRTPIIHKDDTDNIIQAKKKKQTRSERNHWSYWVTQIKLAIIKLKEKGIEISKEEQEKIKDYIYNHDFFNTRLDWSKYKEPQSLEGQITRLADRISVPIEEEIIRYRETGKRLKTVYFKDEITFQERIDFNFENMWNYIKSGKFDEFTFFLSLLSQSAEDFSHPILARIYQKRSSSKKNGIEKILEIAKQEWYSKTDLETMENLINKYINHFWITF